MKEQVTDVQHVNFFTDYENDKEAIIFCKKTGRLYRANVAICEKCPYFVGMGRMDCVICQWKDVPPRGSNTRLIYPQDAQSEAVRVARMVDDGIIKKG